MTKRKVTQLRQPFDATEDAAALSFARRNLHLRFCHSWGQWLIWDNVAWRPDQTVHVFDLIRSHCREHSEFATKTPGETKKFCSPTFVAGVERFLKSDRQYATTAEQYDADDWLLNTPDGIVSLGDGELRPHDADAFCTKITAVGPGGDCPLWRDFLEVVTDGDAELIDYLQRLAGYCLTGSILEHSLHFLYGTGANGKGTFLNALAGMMGDYSAIAPIETFTETRGERHPTELAMLDGPRLVLAQETEQGRKWAETRIKALTGGDPISARRMRQDFFTFTPKFKLLIAGNHKPTLSTVDEAIRRRMHVVPFVVTVPPERRDKALSEKLQAEWPGILAWAIEGCVEYCERDGLDPPNRVVDATDAYLRSQNVLLGWIEDACEQGPDCWETPTLLFANWRAWAKAANERIGQQKDFRERMEAAGFQQCRDNAKGRHWQGIQCKPAEIPEPNW